MDIPEYKRQLPKISPRQIERDHQIVFIHWATYFATYDGEPLAEFLWHTPNGGKRHKAVAIQLKKMGAKPGVPDISCAIPAGGYHGFEGEFKAPKGPTSSEQKKVQAMLSRQGRFVMTARSALDMAEGIANYLTEAPGKFTSRFCMQLEVAHGR